MTVKSITNIERVLVYLVAYTFVIDLKSNFNQIGYCVYYAVIGICDVIKWIFTLSALKVLGFILAGIAFFIGMCIFKLVVSGGPREDDEVYSALYHCDDRGDDEEYSAFDCDDDWE